MQKSINIYRDSEWELACTFNDIIPTEKIIRTVWVHPLYIEEIKVAKVEQVREILEELLNMKQQ